MGVTIRDLVGDLARPVKVEFDNGASLTVIYRPTNYSPDVETTMYLSLTAGRNASGIAYALSKLIESWDLVYADDDEVADTARIGAGETSVTIDHGLVEAPKASQIRLSHEDAKVKKVNAGTFDIVFDEPPAVATRVRWTITGLGGQAIKPTDRYLATLGQPVLERIWEAIRDDLRPNGRRS